jgi:glycosyltransferase involved in cell wall biosynthesis
VDPNVQASLRAHGLLGRTTLVPYVPHATAVKYMRQAGLLLLSIEDFPAADGMMTGKIYEYLAAGRPVLGLGPPDGDAAALLQTTDGGTLFGRRDVGGIADMIAAHYADWAAGAPRGGATPSALGPYRRREQSARMGTVLDEVSSRPQSR